MHGNLVSSSSRSSSRLATPCRPRGNPLTFRPLQDRSRTRLPERSNPQVTRCHKCATQQLQQLIGLAHDGRSSSQHQPSEALPAPLTWQQQSCKQQQQQHQQGQQLLGSQHHMSWPQLAYASSSSFMQSAAASHDSSSSSGYSSSPNSSSSTDMNTSLPSSSSCSSSTSSSDSSSGSTLSMPPSTAAGSPQQGEQSADGTQQVQQQRAEGFPGILAPQQQQQQQQQQEGEEGAAAADGIDSPGVRAALAALKWYKGFLSPSMASTCRFLPTCSQYSMDSYRKYGVAKGTVLTAWRLLRCNPWGGSGYDPTNWPPVGLAPLFRLPYSAEVAVVVGTAAVLRFTHALLFE